MRQSETRVRSSSIRPYLTALGLLLLTILISTATQLTATAELPVHNVLIGNPAAVYCTDVMGYAYEIIAGDDRGQNGICIMPDGTTCDQWDFYAGTCGQPHAYCAQHGYQTQSRTDGQDPFAPAYAVCVSSGNEVVGSVAELSGLRERSAKSCAETPAMPYLSQDGGPPPPAPSQDTATHVPTAFDWRNEDGVNWLTGVKNQAQCGSCWAFAAAGVTEAHYNIITQNPNLDLDLAEQDLLCSTAGSCGGGSSTSALYTIQDDGVVDETCMPYSADDADCLLCSDWQNRLTHVDDIAGFTPNRSTIQQSLVDYGPVYVYMGIDTEYGGYFDGSGIYRCSDDAGINHAVIIVGYNDAGGYWLVRNSWGASWNGDGYFKVGYGECAIDSTYAGYLYATPPTQASNVRPDGWQGPYTKDSTPSFQWDAGYDSGSGLAGYYVAVNDWTPEGSSGSDWWISGAITFTIPDALSDGQHIVAVTSRDRFGNVNPENTNQAGDAPYYTFYVDTTPPASAVEALATEQSGSTFTVRWSGSDATGDITKYDIQVRYGATGDWLAWFTGTSATEGSYEAKQKGVYYFRSRAYDQAGNVEAWPDGDGDTHTDVPIDTEDDDVYVYLPLILGGNTNQDPNTPSSPAPGDGVTGRSTTTNLSWSGGDPNGDTVTYDVYFEANDATPDTLLCDNATSATCDPGTLAYSTHYYWRVVATDEHGATTTGPTWDFTTESDPTDFATEVVNLTNIERAKVGCPPLAVNALLTQAAEGHSEDMALNDFFSHTGSDGSSVGTRVTATGYSWSYVAENIAAGYTTPESVVAGWMDSSGHRANILNCELTEIGVGYYYLANDTGSKNYHHYWTQVLAKPR